MEKPQPIHLTSYTNLAKQTTRFAVRGLKVTFFVISILLTGIFMTLLLGSLGMYLTYSAQFAKISPVSNSTQLVMYDKNGNEFFRGYGAAEPSRVELKDVPKVVQQATLAAEDVDFYKHGPIYLKGLARAIYLNWKDTPGGFVAKASNLFNESGYSQGGSTITQQLVKNIYLTNEKSFDRKIKEATFAYQLEQKYSKDQILQKYLNEIFYGEQSLGIKNAAKTFFNKDLKDLDLAEASMLAGLPQAPTYYDPMGSDMKPSKQRQEYVLQQMYAAGMITLDQAKAAANESLNFNTTGSITHDKYPFYSQYVKDELVSKFGADSIANNGFHVYTSLDPRLQDLSETKVASSLVSLANRGATNAAVVIANPTDKTVLALVGGADWNNSKVNVATSLRQPGSSFKPLVYATGFENGYTAASILKDVRVNFGGNPPYIPGNYTGGFSGYITARNALARSLNIPAVEMGKLAGIQNVINTAHKMGITSINNDAASYGLSLSLGSAEVKLTDMVNAYSTIDDDGRVGAQTAILRVYNNRGELVSLPLRAKKQAISADTSYILKGILSDNNARSATFGSYSPLKTDKTTAVKTGTTDSYADSWTVGFSPDLVIGVWMGNNDHTPMNSVSGAEGAAYIWHDIITEALAAFPDKAFTKPPDIVQAWVSQYNGGFASWQGPPNLLESFKPGTVPSSNPDQSYLKQF